MSHYLTEPRDVYLFTSDWHLDARTAGLARREDLLAALQAIEARALKMSATVVFAGDLADPWKPSSHWAVAQALGMAARLSREGLESIWMRGNHDVIEDGTGDDLLMALTELGDAQNVRVVSEPATFACEAAFMHLLPYPNPAAPYDPRAFVQRHDLGTGRHVFVGHLLLPDQIPGSESQEMPRGREIPWPLDIIAERFPGSTIIAAHHHHARTYERDGLTIHVIGSLGRLTFGESEHAPRYLEMTL